MSDSESPPEGLDLTNFRDCCEYDLTRTRAEGAPDSDAREALFRAAFAYVPDFCKSWPEGNQNLAYVGQQVIQLARLLDLYQASYSSTATTPPRGARVH